MKYRNAVLMLAALLCASCSSTEKRIYDAADEFGVSYNSSDWDKDNTFLYSYQSRNPEEDGSWNNFDRCSYIDCHAEDRRTLADSNAPLSLPFYICLDSSRYPSADFSTLQPILFYEAYTLVDSDDSYEYPYSAKPFDVSIASLPRYSDDVYGYKRLDFPSTNTLYIQYNYSINPGLDLSSIRQKNQLDSFSFYVGIRMWDTETKEYVSYKQKEWDGYSYPEESLFWSNQLLFSAKFYPEEDNQTRAEVYYQGSI